MTCLAEVFRNTLLAGRGWLRCGFIGILGQAAARLGYRVSSPQLFDDKLFAQERNHG